MTLTGVLAGPIAGLKYETPTHRGLTNERGEFPYENGERVAFLVGDTSIGHVRAAPRIHLAQIVARVDGDINKLKDPGVTNIARLVFTLGRGDVRDHGTAIAPEAHDLIGDREIDFRHDADYAGTGVSDKIQAFTDDDVIVELLYDLNRAGLSPGEAARELCTPARARNELRRNAMGILRFRDVKIPLQNGQHVFADVFRPAEPGVYPAIVSCGPYGKAFHHHSICDDADLERHEQMEEDYFFGNAEGQQFENHETVNTATWVPDGYAVVRVDMPGSGKSPGRLAPWGIAGAEAFRDAIEWAGVQPWSNGAVGLWGMSYLAVSQHAAASLRPPHLKAMIAIGTDVDLYEEVAYNGGILNEQFFPTWKESGFVPAICGEPDIADFTRVMKESPFKDSDPDIIFGPRAEMFMSPDLSEVTVPLWSVAATTHLAHFHQLGSSEAYLNTPTSDKKLDFWEDWFQKSYAADSVARHKAFFDHWLKGIDNGIMDTPPVRLEIRTGNGASYLQEENEWPIARTDYTKWFFDASPSDWTGDTARTGFLRLSASEPTAEQEASYSADVESAHPRTTGVSFVSEPLTEDSVVAGYGKAALWVSSTSEDMDIYVSVRVIDERDREVDFPGITTMNYPSRIAPLTKGWLKASHRKLDERRSTPRTPKHTHLKDDHAPLRDGEVVLVEIELIPNTGFIRRGQRLRVDIQPYDGVAHGLHHAYDVRYHAGASNTVHTGPGRVGYVQLPIVPRRPAA
ncbi:CocE/NonD family hydrolase [Streptomyces tsukubensis]|uniref:Hydrolase n=1 Tax=Streptomyces tsukubensis TaxID=83656 RepID=A0A1V4A1J2_9ACTN|nr:CocE/NonD family hydrolase [Streptomyces tsukubensis]OON72173.1 hydrolase [Streptomyces tsukubensis]QFR97091.1 CocE/NonD family hydrolase [Streptomyces tsukubensis]